MLLFIQLFRNIFAVQQEKSADKFKDFSIIICLGQKIHEK